MMVFVDSNVPMYVAGWNIPCARLPSASLNAPA